MTRPPLALIITKSPQKLLRAFLEAFIYIIDIFIDDCFRHLKSAKE